MTGFNNNLIHNSQIPFTIHFYIKTKSSVCSLIMASDSGHSPSFGFPSCLRPHLPASHFSQCNFHLTACLQTISQLLVMAVAPYYIASARTAQKKFLPAALHLLCACLLLASRDSYWTIAGLFNSNSC